MKKYLITYEIKNKLADTSGLYLAIKSLGFWWHYIDSTWIIKSSTLSSAQIYERLRFHFNKEDRLLIIEVNAAEKYGWLPRDAWDWLNS